MPRRRNQEARILGPYYYAGEGWRVVFINGDGGRTHRVYPSQEAADRKIAETRALWDRLNNTTISAALTSYEQHLSHTNNDNSLTERMRRLRLFFEGTETRTLHSIKPKDAGELYERFRHGKSVDYHRNTLGSARGFFDWCAEKEWISANPFARTKGVGKRNAGKLQLTGDEARKFHATALRLADQGDEGALALDMMLLMGLRSSEVWKRRVRDLDLEGSVLRVSEAKTAKSNRSVYVPMLLRPRLLELAEDRSPLAFLFANRNGLPHTNAWLYAAIKKVCAAAGVTEVCPHSLRGAHASIAAEIGYSMQHLADQLGHADARTTSRHYASAEAVEKGIQNAALLVIQGGKR